METETVDNAGAKVLTALWGNKPIQTNADQMHLWSEVVTSEK